MNKPIISVIVPVYNSEKYILKCIESILNQSFSDFELIIVDDGSKDDSIKLVNEHFEDDRIRIIHKENEGLPQARKTGFENSSGKYISFVDSDDWIEKEMLSKLYSVIVDKKCDIVSCGLYFDDVLGKVLKKCISKDKLFTSSQEAIKYIHLNKSIFTYMWNKLFVREIIHVDDFPKGNFIGEDYCTLMNIFLRECTVFNFSECLYHYVQHKSSMMKCTFSNNHILCYNNYKIVEPILIEKYPKLKNNIVSYHYLEKMVLVNVMIKSNIYETQIFNEIMEMLRSRLFIFLTSRLNIIYKLAAIGILYFFGIYKSIYLRKVK